MPAFSSDQMALILSVAQEADASISADMITTMNATYDTEVAAGYPAYAGTSGPAMAPGATLDQMTSDDGYTKAQNVAYLVAMNQVQGGTAVDPNPSLMTYVDAGVSGIAQGAQNAVTAVSNVVKSPKTIFFIVAGVGLLLYLKFRKK